MNTMFSKKIFLIYILIISLNFCLNAYVSEVNDLENDENTMRKASEEGENLNYGKRNKYLYFGKRRLPFETLNFGKRAFSSSDFQFDKRGKSKSFMDAMYGK